MEEKIFTDEYLQKVKSTGVELHRTLALVKELVLKCAELEQQLIKYKEPLISINSLKEQKDAEK